MEELVAMQSFCRLMPFLNDESHDMSICQYNQGITHEYKTMNNYYVTQITHFFSEDSSKLKIITFILICRLLKHHFFSADSSNLKNHYIYFDMQITESSFFSADSPKLQITAFFLGADHHILPIFNKSLGIIT